MIKKMFYNIHKVKDSQNQKSFLKYILEGGIKMARMSDIIEAFIKQLIDEAKSGTIEIQRNEMANYFNCVPSQINYVLGTRFTAERGYYVESRRGGGGYIKIKRLNVEKPGNYIMHIISSMGDSITQQSAEVFINNFIDYEIISEREALLLKAATNDKVLGIADPAQRDTLRASILKNMLASLLIDL